jgi:hypothetical protein
MASALTFDEATHSYTLDGNRVPSVTQVLNVLEDWEGVPPDRLEAARLFGQRVHEACALLVRGVLDWDSLNAALVPYVEGARNFLRMSGAVVIASELRLGNSRHRYAGTLDLMVEWRGQCLADFKSGVVPRTVGPQTAAYSESYREHYQQRPKRRYCIQLNPEAPHGYRVHELKNPSDFSLFLSCLNVWRAKHAS